jgi:exosortase
MKRLLAFGPALVMLALASPHLLNAWRRDTYAAHGPLALGFSLFVLWDDRRVLRSAQGPGDGRGIFVILGAMAAFLGGVQIKSLGLETLAIVGAVAGGFLWALGLETLRRAAFPIGFLLFMAPLPRFVIDTVTLRVQNAAATTGGLLAELAGVPVYQHGHILELPNLVLEVAEICNGLRFLTAFVVFTVALAHISQRTLGPKIVLTLSAVPLAVAANALRVGVVATASYYIGPQAASGFLHHTIGHVVWVLTLAPLLSIAFLLRRQPKKGDHTDRPAGAVA